MLDINDINATIKYYEKQGANLENCRVLADLYTCKSYIENNYNKDNVENELNDILPQYIMYCNVKKEYQLGKVGKECVLKSMEYVCKEITEFMKSLYSHTDMQEERDMLDKIKFR